MTGTLTICATCAARGADPEGAALAAAVGEVEGWTVRMHDCLSMCEGPVAMAVQAQAKATYLFSGVQVADAADVRAFLALYDAQGDGWITDARPAGRLRFCLKGRAPFI
ncbi:DUF1636 family protein [Yoonia sp. 208BN28-4]|uniref:DUF1636 family protein n=1 Tax=Yoonia sp. 208BN28-4 TaxID=3126505 RepID=UPI003095DA24